MKLYNDDIISRFFLHTKYRTARYVFSIVVLTIVISSIVLNNLQYMGSELLDLLEWVVYFTVTFGLIALNIYILVPRYLLTNKVVTYFVSISIFIVIGVAGIGYMQIHLFSLKEIGKQLENTAFKVNFISSVITMGLLVSGSSAILLLKHWINSNKRINEMESATLQSELDMLKNQINPHFLFNMLNNANVLIWKNKEEAQLVIYKLEDLLRYQLHEASNDKVLLTSDIRFLNDFLNLEKIRRDNFEYSISREGDSNNIWIPSLMFIPFVENAVKHNPDSHHLSYVQILIKTEVNILTFKCRNSKPITKIVKKEVGGLGLKNIQRRLALLYPDKHSLVITDEATCYSITLKLDLR